MNTKVAKEGLIYLYCITDNVPELKEIENLVNNLYFIFRLGLYAVVSKVSADEFNEANLKKNLADLEWVKAKVNIHEKVIEEVMKGTCVIPFKFATLFNTENTLKAMLKKQNGILKENLDNLRDKEEWGVKIYCDIEKLKKNLIQEDKELLNLDKEIKSSSVGKAFVLKKKKEELLNTIVNKKLNDYGQESFERLKQHSIRSRINKLLPKEVTERNDEMILNSAFLINKDKVGDFLNIVEDLRAKYTDRGLFFDCTGPWPPYNFCEATTYGAKRT